MAHEQLYFIALIPPPPLRARIRALKEEVQRRFGAGHALKSPAHITLWMPFRLEPAREPELISGLAEFAAREAAFRIGLDGFDCFPPRVIFLRVLDHEPVIRLHERLAAYLVGSLGFAPVAVKSRFHPHLTIATRDLHQAAFKPAWEEFQRRRFRASFEARSLNLLKHNGRYWESYRALAFGNAADASS